MAFGMFVKAVAITDFKIHHSNVGILYYTLSWMTLCVVLSPFKVECKRVYLSKDRLVNLSYLLPLFWPLRRIK